MIAEIAVLLLVVIGLLFPKAVKIAILLGAIWVVSAAIRADGRCPDPARHAILVDYR